jgi:alkylation response protein AidB-like acyl-CoA dehydrogenase
MAVNFDFSADEKIIRDQVSRYLQDNCDSTVVRSTLEGGPSFSKEVWQGLTEMGLSGASIPEKFGGVEAGYLTLCLVAEQLGASLAPVPFSSSIYLAAEALQLFGTQDQKEHWLPRLATGEIIGTLASVESTSEPTPESINTTYQNGTLSGTKLIVPDGNIANMAIVLAVTEAGAGLFITELEDANTTRQEIQTIDPSRDSATISFSKSKAEPLGESSGEGWQQLSAILDRAAILMAFEQIGGAQKALDMAVNYSKERFAFGRPIGSFQALKHMMADMYVALRLAESNCYYAAWALSTNSPDLPLAAATARVSATQAFQLCARDNIQVHGGMGFTWEFDCHLYYRRSNYLALALGGLSVWEEKLVSNLPTRSAA